MSLARIAAVVKSSKPLITGLGTKTRLFVSKARASRISTRGDGRCHRGFFAPRRHAVG
jgi:hypothetical protein